MNNFAWKAWSNSQIMLEDDDQSLTDRERINTNFTYGEIEFF